MAINLRRLKSWAALVRDLGVIIGIPAVICVGLKFYDMHIKAIEAQSKANEAQIKLLETQNALMRETQYDKALAQLKSQKELFDFERAEFDRNFRTMQDKHEHLAREQDNVLARLAEARSQLAMFAIHSNHYDTAGGWSKRRRVSAN